MTGINALMMSDTEVLATLAVLAVASLMALGFSPDFSRGRRTGMKLALGASLAMAAVAGLAWSSVPAPQATAAFVTIAGN